MGKDFICKVVAGRLQPRSGLVARNLGAWAGCEAGYREWRGEPGRGMGCAGEAGRQETRAGVRRRQTVGIQKQRLGTLSKLNRIKVRRLEARLTARNRVYDLAVSRRLHPIFKQTS